MIDQRPDADPPASGRSGPQRWKVVVAIVLLVLTLGGWGAYRLSDGRNEDPGVTACGAADAFVRAGRGEEVAADDVTRVGRLFEDSRHEDLKAKGVLVAGLVQRVQDGQAAGFSPGAELYRRRLSEAVPELVAACANHGVTVED
ncbi:hypothetical protein GA0074696_2778 [Micromonospora purpureochromogenes]|uniref:Uncharacterized protein n=1 Tax=Micromonospora purpureochromogenes TaxID=47872 RepID=A0A1C4XQV3_9ACTN|nr:hypothetical protein [Micromonospora purpureochromogenes]SCF10843.1 hypothetical protein GA0074696_2778 [Micromonospora purpureochromogenes]